MKQLLFILTVTLSSTCIAHDSNNVPSLGSWYKDIDKSVAACMLQSAFELKDMGVKHMVENDYGVYGVYKGNRIVVKCMERKKHSTLLVMVAGADHDLVEVIRNRIVSAIH